MILCHDRCSVIYISAIYLPYRYKVSDKSKCYYILNSFIGTKTKKPSKTVNGKKRKKVTRQVGKKVTIYFFHIYYK
jgi:hypothetical protein